ncbi:MAG: hypothetical protein FWC97_06755 [Treponema sp.]|nr:hypothetical protein [Treponema sp.]
MKAKLKLGWLIVFLFVGISAVSGQDLIFLRNGDLIEGRVVEISSTEIRYRRIDFLDGPVFVISVADILTIRFEDGIVQIFNEAPIAEQPRTQTSRRADRAADRDRLFSAGLEAGLRENFWGGHSLYLRPVFTYQNDIENTSFHVEFGIPMSEGIGIDFILGGSYNFALSNAGNLRLILESQTGMHIGSWDSILFTPAIRGGTILGSWLFGDIVSWLVPGVRYTHELSRLSFFGQLDIPFVLFSDGEIGAFDITHLDLIFGVRSELGFGFDIELINWLNRPEQWRSGFFQFLTLTPFFDTGRIYGEVALRIPVFEDGVDIIGMTFTPEIRFIFNVFQAFLNFEMSRIGAEFGETGTAIGMGLKFRF